MMPPQNTSVSGLATTRVAHFINHKLKRNSEHAANPGKVAMFNLQFRIGTKLAASAGIGVLMMIAMIVNQQIGSSSTAGSIATANLQQRIAADAIDAKAALGGMHVGVRDLRLARTTDDVRAAEVNIASRRAAAVGFVDSLLRQLDVADARERVQKVKSLIDAYAGASRDIVAGKVTVPEYRE